jgi:hypothetical protein
MRSRILAIGMLVLGLTVAIPALAAERTVLMEMFTNAY